MAHEEAEIVRQHLHFRERHHVLTDGTRRGRNRQAALGASKNETTYSLMAHEEAEIMRRHLCFKERDTYFLMAHEEAEIMR